MYLHDLLVVCLVSLGSAVHGQDLSETDIPEPLKISERSVDDRIFNGKNAVAGQFPYQARLHMTDENDSKYICGGCLISPLDVLTAAHCCTGIIKIEVYLGLINLNDIDSSHVQKFELFNNSDKSDFIIHKDYDPINLYSDICILHLRTPAQINDNVSAIALPYKYDLAPSQYDNKEATVSGWGQTMDWEALPEDLKFTKVHIMAHRLCSFSYFPFNNVDNSQICSDKLTVSGPCKGDSGGPLTTLKSSEKCLIALVSWGLDVVWSCTSVTSVVYTYIPAFLPWIKLNARGDLTYVST